ncbi:hypothetical protein QYM36_015795 [Artemia franciscana]|uniref:C-type lectin domain-containing protein n=1 Tax=Artemia franciscana TaxID=6661 RepID=A0AA88KVU7_ARTSF|nr:hypothetical protein QYM36_015795 [Artemia franciscana]
MVSKKLVSRLGLACEDGWDLVCTGETINDCSCLKFYDECVRYSTAELICGKNLPVIHSELKNKLLFVYPDYFYLGAWIGLKFNGTEFIWVDGSELSVEYWNLPLNSPTGDGDCVHFVGDKELSYNGQDFKWKDGSCNEYRPLVCEMRPTRIATTITDSKTEETPEVSQTEMTTIEPPETTTTEQSGACPPGYTEKCFDSSCFCYGVKKTLTYWGNAVAVCKSEGADLVSIHSEKENSFINMILEGKNAWIGCLYSSTIWVDGTNFNNYTNWFSTYEAHTLGWMNNDMEHGTWMGLYNHALMFYYVCKKVKE